MDTPLPIRTCAECGQPIGPGKEHGVEQLLEKIGINDEMINNLKTQLQNVDLEQSFNTAREYIQGGGQKAKQYAKENPRKVAASVAVLVVGAGLLISALNRD